MTFYFGGKIYTRMPIVIRVIGDANRSLEKERPWKLNKSIANGSYFKGHEQISVAGTRMKFSQRKLSCNQTVKT